LSRNFTHLACATLGLFPLDPSADGGYATRAPTPACRFHTNGELQNMTHTFSKLAVTAVALLAFGARAKPPATEDLVRARTLVFGAEHVDQRTGQVDQGKVIFSWLTNATLAASIKGHVVL